VRRTVLVTGATSGIGLATVLHLPGLGFHTVGSARSADEAEELRDRAGRAGVQIETIVLDLHEPHAGEEVLSDLGVWGLVNNAGYMNVGPIEDVPIDTVRRQFEAMVFAPVRLAQLVLPGMRSAGEGRIVNVSSVMAHVTGPLIGWYQAAKHAMSATTDALRIEVSDFGIDVSLIEPGGHHTGIWAKAEADLVARRQGSVYQAAYDRGLDILRSMEPKMSGPEPVAEAIGRTLRAGRPRSRTRVGADTPVLETLHKVLPQPAKDWLTRSAVGL
jgi:short-subunit dehydrogenase